MNLYIFFKETLTNSCTLAESPVEIFLRFSLLCGVVERYFNLIDLINLINN